MLRQLLLAAFVLPVIMLQAADNGSQLTVQEISELPAKLRSCQLEYRTAFSQAAMTVAVEGKKYRIETPGMRTGFDGETHWVADPRRGNIATAKEKPLTLRQVAVHPLTVPYLWVWGDPGSAVWSELQSEQAWKAVQEKMQFHEERVIRDQTCDVYRVSYPELDKEYEVAFARELDGFPVQVSTWLGGKHIVTVDVLKTQRDGSGAIVALQIQSTQQGKEPVMGQRVDVDSLRINQPIDQNLFEADRTPFQPRR